VLDVFHKLNFSKSIASTLFQRFLGLSQVVTANGEVGLANKIFIHLLNVILGMEKTKKSYQSYFQPNLVNRIIWQLCTRFN
jgi:hypothetical protein